MRLRLPSTSAAMIHSNSLHKQVRPLFFFFFMAFAPGFNLSLLTHSILKQIVSKPELGNEEFTQKVLNNRRWTLPSPEAKIHQLIHTQGPTFLLNTHPSFGDANRVNEQRKYFYVVRDDLLHPLVNGNKARKLDGLLPLLQHYSVTDVVQYNTIFHQLITVYCYFIWSFPLLPSNNIQQGHFLGYMWRLSECSHSCYW